MEFFLISCFSCSCPQLARVCYVYYLSKFVEYLDTVSAFSVTFPVVRARDFVLKVRLSLHSTVDLKIRLKKEVFIAMWSS